MGSGRTYDRAKNVANKIEELNQQKKEKDAEFLKIMLNESIRGTEDILKADCLDKISDELKDRAINKDLSVSNAVKEIKKE